jgi:hypothetical protein
MGKSLPIGLGPMGLVLDIGFVRYRFYPDNSCPDRLVADRFLVDLCMYVRALKLPQDDEKNYTQTRYWD